MILAAKIGIGVYWLLTLTHLVFPFTLPAALPGWVVPGMAGFILFLHVLEFVWFRSAHPGEATIKDFVLTLIFGFTHLLPRHQEISARSNA